MVVVTTRTRGSKVTIKEAASKLAGCSVEGPGTFVHTLEHTAPRKGPEFVSRPVSSNQLPYQTDPFPFVGS